MIGNTTIRGGRHDGLPITRVPLSYLRWMVNSAHRQGPDAAVELKRRGTDTPTMEVTFHAIDRASTRLLPFWQASRKKGEGIYAWLHRKASGALSRGKSRHGRIHFEGMVFVFEEGVEWPSLVTVMKER